MWFRGPCIILERRLGLLTQKKVINVKEDGRKIKEKVYFIQKKIKCCEPMKTNIKDLIRKSFIEGNSFSKMCDLIKVKLQEKEEGK